MRIILLVFIFNCVFNAIGISQQDAQYTQFMFNKLALNPAYAGNWNGTAVTLLQRNQWSGFEGAPSNQSFTLNTSLFKNKIGLGLIATRDKIGATESWNLAGSYSYKLQLNKGILAIGLQASIRTYALDWASLQPNESNDPIATNELTEKLIPNFGIGFYYQQANFYAGLSVPNIQQNSLNSIVNSGGTTSLSLTKRHAYLMAGGMIYNSDKLKVKMASLVKYAANSPIDIDLHTSTIFFDKLWTGFTLRHGGLQINNDVLESIDLVLQYQFTQGLRIGLAYDISLSEVGQYHSGTYEVMAFIRPINKKNAVQNPRFF